MKSSFNKLSAAEKRVAIAQDVIDTVKAKKAIVKTGNFLQFDDLTKADTVDSKTLREILKKTQKPCKICALGGIMLSQLNINGDCDVTDISYKNCYSSDELRVQPFREDVIDDYELNDFITQYFSVSQLQLIEIAFELGEGYYNCEHYIKNDEWDIFILDQKEFELTETAAKKAIEFGEEYIDRIEDRLIVIMNNIIKNNGKFIV